ncbi:MAG: amino acid permease [Proteobacteria bacterium]|nr:amino acid permease [Pseudomonadota bacterium]
MVRCRFKYWSCCWGKYSYSSRFDSYDCWTRLYAIWLGIAIVTFPIVFTLGSFGRIIPNAGGVLSYITRAFGTRFTRAVSFALLGSVPIGTPIVALIGANYLGGFFSLSPLIITLIAFLMIFISLLLNAVGLKIAARAQISVVCMVITFILFSMFSGLPFINKEEFTPFLPMGWGAVGYAMVPIFFSFCGWEMITSLAEEYKNPERNFFPSLLTAAIIITILYVGVSFVTVASGVYHSSKAMMDPFSILIGQAFGKESAFVVTILAVLMAFMTTHINITGFSRLIYAQARSGNLPSCLSSLHEKYKTPIGALWSLGGLFVMTLLTQFIFQFDLIELIKLPSTVFVFSYVVIMAAGVKLFKKQKWVWVSSFISLIMCLFILLLSTYVMIFPLILFFIGWVLGKSRHTKNNPSLNDLM